jgi:para-nitrobenzyl esterase
MKKRYVLTSLCTLLIGCSDGGDSIRNENAWSNNPIVQSLSGPVEGLPDVNDTWSWKAIPYAAPPIGELRWKAPRDPMPWEQPLVSDTFGKQCIQFSQLGSGLVGSEDCLTLNVWRPQSQQQKLPVYVWIHGGGNTSGSAGLSYHDGANLAATSNVVFVSMNYRLGPFGWFYNEALLDGDPNSDSGNFGTLDVIKSLQWIRDNIELFGGDPNNVFITGESGGGINVLSLLLSTPASGLFHKAMSQSGLLAETNLEGAARFSNTILPGVLVEEGLAADEAVAEAQLAQMTAEEVRDLLLAAAPSSLMEPIPKIGVGLLSMPILYSDGHVIVEDVSKALEQGTYPNKVPLILGTNSGDVRLFLFILDNPLSADMEMYNSVSEIGGILWQAAGADEFARAMVKAPGQPDIYVYSFEWGRYATDGSAITPELFNYLIGAGHSIDIPFFLDTLDRDNQLAGLLFTEENRKSRNLLSAEMIRYVQNFIHTGDPNGDGLDQEWYPWSNAEGSPKSIIFDAGFDELSLGVDYEGVSRKSAQEAIDALPEPDLRQRVTDYLLEFVVTCALLSDNPSEDCGN